MSPTPLDKATRFRARHSGGSGILVLPNAWDVASARIFASLGAEAIGTTSLGISASRGMREGESMTWEIMRDAIAAIVAAVEIPVTADIEHGYADDPQRIADRVEEIIGLGAVGVNIEDSVGGPGGPLVDPSILVERLQAIRERANRFEYPLTINAKTDVLLTRANAPRSPIDEAIRRGVRYVAAGADCVFVPGGIERSGLTRLVQEIDAPINVVANPAIASPQVPPVAELEELGIRRVSIGSGAMLATLGFLRRIGQELLGDGTYRVMGNEFRLGEARRAYDAAVGED